MKSSAVFTSERRNRFIVVRDRAFIYAGEPMAAHAAAVVPHCLRQHGDYRMIFRDGDGDWRELRHDGQRLVEIADLGADELAEILELCGLRL